MEEKAKKVNIKVSENEIRYMIACGFALLQNIPEKSLSSYCDFTKDDIINFSSKIKKIANESNIDM